MAEEMKEGMISWFDLTLDRRSDGVTLVAKADPRVEAFISGLGYGESDPTDLYGRMWVPSDVNRPLRVYRVVNDLGGRFLDRYTINAPCGAFDTEGVINLSFLRLVGMSEGVSFKIELPMSRSRVSTLKAQLIEGVEEFLREFIVPVHVKLKVVSLPKDVIYG
jgi:hypothetical protein